jgi:WD40 repeat protein
LPRVEGNWNVLQTLEGHLNYVNAVAFSPDGKLLASASFYEDVILWDSKSGAVLQRLDVGAVVETLSFSDYGTSLQIDRGSLPLS